MLFDMKINQDKENEKMILQLFLYKPQLFLKQVSHCVLKKFEV